MLNLKRLSRIFVHQIATPVFSNMFEINTHLDYRLLSIVIDYYGLLSIVIDFRQSIKIDNFCDFDYRYQPITISDLYRVYRLISDVNFYRLTTPGVQRFALSLKCRKEFSSNEKFCCRRGTLKRLEWESMLSSSADVNFFVNITIIIIINNNNK